jgi:hypothetical protein
VEAVLGRQVLRNSDSSRYHQYSNGQSNIQRVARSGPSTTIAHQPASISISLGNGEHEVIAGISDGADELVHGRGTAVDRYLPFSLCTIAPSSLVSYTSPLIWKRATSARVALIDHPLSIALNSSYLLKLCYSSSTATQTASEPRATTCRLA